MSASRETPPHAAAAEDTRPPVVFAVFQTGNRANGGVESITQVVERLERFRPVLVTQLETPTTERWRRAGAEVHVWPLPYRMGTAFRGSLGERGRRIGAMLRTNLRMARLVRRTGAGVVHCNDMLALMHTAPGARMAGAAVVRNIRDTKAPGERYGARWRLSSRLSARTVVLSRDMQRRVFGAIHPGERPEEARGWRHVYSIVDLDRMRPPHPGERERLRAGLGIPAAAFALGYVATFNPKKDQLAFIRGTLPLLAAIPGLRVYFIGDFEPERDPYAAACLAAVRELGLEASAEFVSFAPNVDEWYRALDLLVLASRQEGLARCMIEGLACGVPMVSVDVSSAREILEENGCGIVVPRDRPDDMADAVAALRSDPARLARLSARGVEVARRLFGADANFRAYEQIYAELSPRA